MKNTFFRLSLAIISLVTMLSLLAACSDTDVTSNVSNTPVQTTAQTGSNPTATATATAAPATTTAVVTPTVVATTAPATTAVPTTTSAPATTTVALPTVTPQPKTTAAPTATPEPPTPTSAPTYTPKPAATTAPVVKVTVPGTNPVASSSGSKLPGKITFEASGIFVVNPDGTGLKQIAEGHSPVFSPDGKRVAFISDDDSAINSVDLDGKNLQYHCPTEGHLARIIRWSPTGKWVAVDSLNEDGTSEVRLCDMTYKGIGALETVIRENVPVTLVFDWSLDEKYILWQTGLSYPGYDKSFDLWYSKPETGIQQWLPVTEDTYKIDLAEGPMYVNARISPTNKTVAIVGSKLFFLSVPGYKSSYDNLVLDQFENVDGVAWSPDSAAVLISGVYQGNPGMFLYYFESKKVVQLTDYLSSGYLDWTRK